MNLKWKKERFGKKPEQKQINKLKLFLEINVLK
jgi:hypothetical protein